MIPKVCQHTFRELNDAAGVPAITSKARAAGEKKQKITATIFVNGDEFTVEGNRVIRVRRIRDSDNFIRCFRNHRRSASSSSFSLCVCVCFTSNAIKTYFPVDEKNVSALAFALVMWQAGSESAQGENNRRSPKIHCNQIWTRRDGKCFPLGNEIASCFWGVPLVSASTRKV